MGPLSSPAAPPGGYTQNAYAQDMSPAQRASLDVAEENEGRSGSLWNALSGVGGAGGAEGGGGSASASTGEGAWGAVKGWVGATTASVGTKLAEAEGEVWKRVGGGK
jgi:hypothetical protein